MATKKAKLAKPASDEKRVASFGKRNRSFSLSGNTLPNPDPTLSKFAPHKGIGLFDQVRYQFAGLAGHMQAWVDHILVNPLVIKPAKADTPEAQDLANKAADRASKAWERVRNRNIVLQTLLYARFYGFARAEKVWRFDTAINEWIQDLYDVPQRFWKFDDDGREFLTTLTDYKGKEVDPSKFIHVQWGSADTKYGEGDLSKCYLSLWKIQQLEDKLLERIEENESKIVVHVPRMFGEPDRLAVEDAFAEHYNTVIMVPHDGSKVEIDDTNMSLVASGATGRPESAQIDWHWSQVQTAILGTPQTGTKQLGTGKVEETRKAVWDDKTPLGLAMIDTALTSGWLDDYYAMNMPDLPPELRARFDSTTTDLADGLNGPQSVEFRNIALDLGAKRIPALVAVEAWVSMGVAPQRAQAMADAVVADRDGMEKSAAAEASAFRVGDRVVVRDGAPHGDIQPGDAGEIAEIGSAALGIKFDDMPDMVHRWYTAEELDAEKGGERKKRAGQEAA